ncbi:MAG: hypothetical protein GY835_08495 [bacterium]|nr:hypothetical protein [bacterium]
MPALHIRLTLMLTLPVLILCGCNHSLKAPIDLDPSLQDVQNDYARIHPDDPFIESIQKQELVYGMTPTHVFLAWGRPLHREKDGEEQKWLYRFDENTPEQPKQVTHLKFEDGLLTEWHVNHGFVYFLESVTNDGEPTDNFEDLPNLTLRKGANY